MEHDSYELTSFTCIHLSNKDEFMIILNHILFNIEIQVDNLMVLYAAVSLRKCLFLYLDKHLH